MSRPASEAVLFWLTTLQVLALTIQAKNTTLLNRINEVR